METTGTQSLMDAEFIKWLATLGIGGILAGFMFMFYRKDVKQYTELWKLTTDQLTIIVKENTASNTKLIALLENQERNTIRIHDIERLVDRRAHITGQEVNRRAEERRADIIREDKRRDRRDRELDKERDREET